MTTVAYASDLHLEFGNPVPTEGLGKADILVLAVHADITPSRTAIPAYRWWRPHLPRLSRSPSAG